MTDKEVIMIDGIRPEECEHCLRICQNSREPEAICKLYKYCTNNPNCHYKQLNLKTLIANDYKLQYQIQKQKNECLQVENEELKQELQNKENEIVKLKDVISGYMEMEVQFEATNEMLRAKKDELEDNTLKFPLIDTEYAVLSKSEYKKMKNYEQVLQTILDLLSDQHRFEGIPGYSDLCEQYEKEQKYIQNIINEVLKSE